MKTEAPASNPLMRMNRPAVNHFDRNEQTNDIFIKQLIATLGAIEEGDFTARLPLDWTGPEGRVADQLNAISARMERFNESLVGLRRQVGQEGKINVRLSIGDSIGNWGEQIEAINAVVDELSQPTVEVGRVIGAVAKGDLAQSMPLELNGRPLKGEYLRTAKLVNGMVGQLGCLFRRSDPRGARSRHGGQARRPGPSQGRVRRVEGIDRIRQPDGGQPDRPGPQHRRSDHRGGQRRLVQKNHRGRARRNSPTQGGHQRHGGSTAFVRRGGDARGARSGHRRQTRRPGGRARRGRHVEGPDRLRQRHGVQPHGAGPQHRRRDHGRGARRLVAQDHGGREGRNSRTQGNHQHDGGPAQRASPRK